MGWWKSQHGLIGDRAADALDDALGEIVDSYREEAERLPTQGELADLVEFCTSQALVPQCGAEDHPWSIEGRDVDAMPHAASAGRQGCFFATPPPGKLANVDPKTGEHYDAE